MNRYSRRTPQYIRSKVVYDSILKEKFKLVDTSKKKGVRRVHCGHYGTTRGTSSHITKVYSALNVLRSVWRSVL